MEPFNVDSLFGGYSQAVVTYIAVWLFGAAVQSLPEPDLVNPSKVYVFFFNFAHAVAANVKLISRESQKRTIVADAIQGTGDGTGTGTVTEKKAAVAEAKKEILEISAEKLDVQASVPVKG